MFRAAPFLNRRRRIVEIMIAPNQFKKGMTIVYKGNKSEIMDYQHIKPGKGGAFVRLKVKNISTRSIIEETIRPTEKFEQVMMDQKNYEYLYRDGSSYIFMDSETYDQIPLGEEYLTDFLPYMKENMKVKVVTADDEIVSVDPPRFVELKVTMAEPGVKGDTATGAEKSVTLETGATVNVPLFVNEGDVLKIDTKENRYVERV